jgi:probable F420-dependent oxidoreductase
MSERRRAGSGVRIGFGLGTRGMSHDDERFGPLVDDLERLAFDSLWLSERIGHPGPDPMVGLAFAAGRTRKLKLGTSVMVLPGRSPATVAKAWASLDRLSGGRTLPAFGLGLADPHEQQAFGVDRKERAARFDEALDLVRRCWTEDRVEHAGRFYRYDGVSVLPKPVQSPPDVWLGGRSEAELRRVGRVGDGWLPSFTTPDEAARGWKVINEVAAEHDRAIDPGHFGVLIPYSRGTLPDGVVELFKARFPDADPAEIIPAGLPALRTLLERFVDVGASKFVVVPIEEPDDWTAELEDLHATVVQGSLSVTFGGVHRQKCPKARRAAAVGSPMGRQRMTKYFASGWWQTIADVDCSGSSWNSSVSVTPMRSSSSSSATCCWSSRSGHAG